MLEPTLAPLSVPEPTQACSGGVVGLSSSSRTLAPLSLLFPILKQRNEGIALGFITARVVGSVFIAVGILSLLAVVTLRQDVTGAAG
ncbi:MAG: DUF4386 family protein [Kouleothrix sp.]|nr:DUF4386 family protein [Kouleothrix sp.]